MATKSSLSTLVVRAFLYGCGSMVLLFDIYFLGRAIFTTNFIPILPILVGIMTASGLVLIIYAEHDSRQRFAREHRRLARVAHQLERPLTNLQTDFQVLLDQAQQLPPEARLKLKHMATSTQTVLDNIRDIFLLLQGQEGSIIQEQRVYDLCAIVDEVLDRERSFAQARNTQIMHQFHCQEAPVSVDRRLLIIVLKHLVENAMLYTLTPGLMNVAVTRSRQVARVIIQDRGVGIRPSDRWLMWQPFARGRNAEQFDRDGIGVGLTLSNLIMRQLGGRLIYHPRSDSTGSQFEIELPLAKTEK